MTEERKDDRLLTPEEVGPMFRVDAKTVSRWAREGRIPAVRTLGGHYRFWESEMKRVREEQSK